GIRSADFSASIARGDKSEGLPIGVPPMSNLRGTRRRLLQALLCSADGALELVRQHDQHLGELFGRRPLDFGLIEEEIQLVRHAARQLGDSRKSERTAGALQLMRDEKELGEGLFELRSEAETVLA